MMFPKDMYAPTVIGRKQMRRITKTPGVCGGRACIDGTRIPVWILWRLWHDGLDNDAVLACYPTLDQDDLNEAMKYIKGNTKEIIKDWDEEKSEQG